MQSALFSLVTIADPTAAAAARANNPEFASSLDDANAGAMEEEARTATPEAWTERGKRRNREALLNMV
jgi:hypothetical protein